MLVLRPSWQAALPCITQMGNGVALGAELDRLLATEGSSTFMQVAPLIGIAPTPAETLQQVWPGQDSLPCLLAAGLSNSGLLFWVRELFTCATAVSVPSSSARLRSHSAAQIASEQLQVCLQSEPVPLHRALLGADSPESDEPGSDAAANLQAAEILMQQVCVTSE